MLTCGLTYRWLPGITVRLHMALYPGISSNEVPTSLCGVSSCMPTCHNVCGYQRTDVDDVQDPHGLSEEVKNSRSPALYP